MTDTEGDNVNANRTDDWETWLEEYNDISGQGMIEQRAELGELTEDLRTCV